MFADYHLHSQFSADSDLDLDTICRTAVNKGIKEIAVTDHYDIDYMDDTIEFILDKENYLNELEKYQQKFAGKLKIKKGIEMGLQLHIFEECDNYLADDFDFIIGSFHTVEKADLYRGDFFRGYEQWEAYLQYLKTVLNVIKNYNNFNVIGHLDLVRRYGDFDSSPDLMENKTAAELVKEILKILIKKDKGLEVNTSGYHLEDGKNPMPSWNILELYYELGGKILTLGSDSHYSAQIGYKFEETAEKLKEIGFKTLTTFTEGKPDFYKI